MNYILVFFGSGLGGLARYLATKVCSSWLPQDFFINTTLLVNLLGSFLIGIAAYLIKMKIGEMNTYYWQLLVIGFLGGFTTFSSFSLDTLLLIQQDKLFIAVIYILMTVVVGIVLCALGYKLASLL